MIIPRPQDTVHKAWLYRILIHFYDNLTIATHLYFKGGTCAAMLGRLDRFSIDLDFDFIGEENTIPNVQKEMESVFKELVVGIKQESKIIPQYSLKYPAKGHRRNTVKINVFFPPPKANQYTKERFTEIDRIIPCQTKETMFANKLVAVQDRYQKTKGIAGRDIYDIHHFFSQKIGYHTPVITERTGKTPAVFFRELINFIERHVTQTVIYEDLNTLLPYKQFVSIRKTLKQEALIFLEDELQRVHL